MVLEASVDPKPEQERQQQRQTDAVHEESDALTEDTTSGSIIFDRVYEMMERFSAMRIGQFALERGDRLLRIFEDTAKWSLPQDKDNDFLVRPLPWLPFLLLIILLRQLRLWLSLAALLIGNGPVTASSLVYFIQTRRRKLRSIRLHGLKAIQQREHERQVAVCEHNNCLMLRLGKLVTTAMCRPRIHCEPAGVVFSAQNPAMRELLRPIESPRFRFNKRQREDDCPEAELCCSQLLTKYANENSEDDSDYMPQPGDDDTSNESTVTANTSNDTQGEYSMDTSDENAKDISSNEKKDANEVKSPMKKILPIIEFNVKEAGNTSTPNNEQNDKKEQALKGKNEKALTKAPQTPQTPKTPHTPLDNGQSKGGKGGALAEKAVVVQTPAAPAVTKPQSEKCLSILNGHNDEQKKATPGHESAAHTKPQLPSPLLGSVVANATPSDGKLIDANAACTDNPIAIPTNTPVPPPTPPPPTSTQQPLSSPTAPTSPSCFTTSSNSSLASLMSSDDFVINDARSDTPIPTPALNMASSSEDIYLSPFGTPPNFNTFHKPSPGQPNTKPKFSESEDATLEDGDEHSQHAKQAKLQPKPQHQQQQQHKHHQRYRRNRR